MTRLARQALVVIYQARLPADPTWPPGPLILQEGQIRSTAEARSEYYNDKAARVLYGSAERPRRWHDPSRRVMGGIEVVGVEALRASVAGPDAHGLVAVHLRPRHGSPIALLRALAGRRGAPRLDFDPQVLLDGQAVIESTGSPFTISFVAPGARGLPRLYRQPRYWRWAAARQWLWTLASRTTLADYPPDPGNLEPREDEIIRLSSDWHAVVLRDGMGVVGIRPDQGRDDKFFGYAELYLRSIYLDAILLGLMQQQGITHLEKRMAAALDSSLTATMADLEGRVSAFRHHLWAQHLTPHGIPNRVLTAYQRQHALRERFEQILLDISDFNRLNRDEENRYVNSAVVVFTLATVPTGIALALLQVLETHNPWLFAAVGFACALLTAVLLRTRSARVALRALRRRFTIT
ncbi:hypothetical protein ACFHYQ_09575 [Sphaerimonospora cavernae]|uniref:CorA-like Mg2+ transporter protein n=1 Tax=Sphaerimonospora cavernae TaxID=1740611 RepID=A0ABV6U278_9ACTN